MRPKVADQVRTAFDRVIEPIGPTRRFCGGLAALAGEGSSQLPPDARLRLERTTMVDVAAEPERRGPAERRRNPRDRRAHDLTITEAGRNVFARLKTTEAEDATFAPLSAAERRRLREHLAQLLGPGSSAAKGGGSPRIVPSRPIAAPRAERCTDAFVAWARWAACRSARLAAF